MKNLFLSTVVGLSLASPVLAQDSFDVQQAMEQVRKENLQRIGVERKQQIVSTLRKRAEDLAAINEAGYTVTPDGRLEPKQAAPGSASEMSQNNSSGGLQSGMLPDGQVGNAGLFSEGGGLSVSPEGDMPAWMKNGLDSPSADSVNRGSSDITLKAILSNLAVLSVNGSVKRYRKGDELPGGSILVAINPRSVDVKRGEAEIETFYMDWSSASTRVPGASGSGGSTSEPRTFMQSGQPVEGFGAGF